MANKPIINIDVNAEQFKAFYELYEQFEAKVASMPKEWQQIDMSMRRNAATAKVAHERHPVIDRGAAPVQHHGARRSAHDVEDGEGGQQRRQGGV
ncbi:hypothetical protein [Burkholderia sp. CCA53]|uniref:hypothetical protein n=1 Tax=Burkholderia sp. CCA53 TaxID=1776288 RepID=UPI0020C81F1C|nr:hypothetical protein [Burkholderia sp. CCA53]